MAKYNDYVVVKYKAKYKGIQVQWLSTRDKYKAKYNSKVQG